jgi:hypothetical protein
MKKSVYYLLIVVILLISSCATIISGSRQNITINSDVQGAKVSLLNRRLFETPVGTTPCSVSTKRTTMYASFKKDGYKDVTIKLKRGVSVWFCVDAGLVLLGYGLLGVPIDFITGSYLRLPQTIYAQMELSNQFNTEIEKKPETKIQSQFSGFSIGDNVSFKNEKGEYHDGKIIGINKNAALVQYKTVSGEMFQCEVEISKLFKLQ